MFERIEKMLSKESFPPESLIIPHTDYYGKYVGITGNGNLFFITTPFELGAGGAQREFVACYIFENDGSLKEAQIEELGTRAEIVGEGAHILPGNIAAENSKSQDIIQEFLSLLGTVSYQDIRVKPWAVERFGLTFGLVSESYEGEDLEEDEYEEDEKCLILEPGNYMAFMPPWDGDFDT